MTFTGVLLYKRVGETPLAYKAIAPEAPAHFGFVRYSEGDATPSGFAQSNKFTCAKVGSYSLRLKNDGLAIEPASALVDEPGLDSGDTFNYIASLKNVAGAKDEDFDKDYDKSKPQVGKVAAQFLLDRGSLEPVIEENYTPILWHFQQHPTSGSYCGVTICGISGVRLKLKIRKDTPSVDLVSVGTDKRLKITLANGRATAITIGNSRAKDIECKGMKEKVPDHDFAHHYKMLKNIARRCIPFPDGNCPTGPVTVVDSRSIDGSNCLGSQWP